MNSPRATITAEPPTRTRSIRPRVALDARVERRRAPDLDALRDLDLLAERDAAVAGEMHGERPRRRAGRGVLGHAVGRREHARLPAGAVAREAVHAVPSRRGERAGRPGAAPPPPRASRARRRRGPARCRRARPAARSARRRARRGARRRIFERRPAPGSAAPSSRSTIRAPSRSSSTGTTPAPVSSRITIFCSGPPSTKAEPSVGCPANGSSLDGVKMRIRTSASAACGRQHEDRLARSSSRARAPASSASSSSRASVNTASWLPASGVSVKTSAKT